MDVSVGFRTEDSCKLMSTETQLNSFGKRWCMALYGTNETITVVSVKLVSLVCWLRSKGNNSKTRRRWRSL